MNKLVRCKNEYCRALFQPGDWIVCERPPPDDTTGSPGRKVGEIPRNECPMCRMDWTN